MTPVLQIIGILESKLAISGRRTRVGPVSITTDETGRVRIEPKEKRTDVSTKIRQRKSKAVKPTRRVKGSINRP